ncbi:NUDIX domain-containing protein [Streptomyces sp. NPDC007369]|uniref:NUDIX hydrolase n=1 Tax=Streptomyces sp. NPDC007369 TaxID=3154589 RepID=UPI0033F765DF
MTHPVPPADPAGPAGPTSPADHAPSAPARSAGGQQPALPFARITVRTGALVFCGDEVALIRRDRPASALYTLPGGNVEDGEDFTAALHRELAEELALDAGLAEGGGLMWVVDQRVTRPGPTAPPRKLHLVYRFHITPALRAGLAGHEADELPDGTHDIGVIEWIDYREAASLPLFPPVGAALAALPEPRAAVPDAALPPVTDRNYSWI